MVDPSLLPLKPVSVSVRGTCERFVAAISAGLSAMGCVVMASDGPPRQPWGDIAVVLVVDSLELPAEQAATLRAPWVHSVVAVGPRSAAAALTAAVALGASAVLSSEQPFLELLATLDRAVRGLETRDTGRMLTRRLHGVLDGARLMASLTPAEEAILAELVRGRRAAQIASASQLSISTVRSQIRAVLVKLGTTSQMEAVAHAHRFAVQGPVAAATRKLPQF